MTKKLIEHTAKGEVGKPKIDLKPLGASHTRWKHLHFTLRWILLIWVSNLVFTIFLMKEYYDQSIWCSPPTNFTSASSGFINHHCWAEGDFNKETCAGLAPGLHCPMYGSLALVFLRHSFFYFLLRLTLCSCPFLLWKKLMKKREDQVVDGIVSIQDVLLRRFHELRTAFSIWRNEPQELYGVEPELAELRELEQLLFSASLGILTNTPCKIKRAVPEVTIKDILEKHQQTIDLHEEISSITYKMCRHYSNVPFYLTLKGIIEESIVLFFLIPVDFEMAWRAFCYADKGYECVLPNGETISCVIHFMKTKRIIFAAANLVNLIILIVDSMYYIYLIYKTYCDKEKPATILHAVLPYKFNEDTVKRVDLNKLYKFTENYIIRKIRTSKRIKSKHEELRRLIQDCNNDMNSYKPIAKSDEETKMTELLHKQLL